MNRRPKKSRPAVPHDARSNDSQLCQHFVRQKCGGCNFLHIPYAQQIESKREKVTAILNGAMRNLPRDIQPDLANLVLPTVKSPLQMKHRASAKFCLHEDRFGSKVIGLYKQGSRVVINTTDCPANVDLANDILKRLFSNRAAVPAKFYDHQGRVFQKGRFKFLTIRTSPAGKGTLKDAAVVITHTGVDKEVIAGWLKRVGLADLCAYESRVTKADGDSFTGRSMSHASGPETFPYLLDNEVFSISPASFFQANHSLAPSLIDAATGFDEDGDILLDLYGGFGAYSFHLRSRFNEIIVVDGNRAAIAAANNHAKKIGATHLSATADFCEHFLESALPKLSAEKVTHIIVNPSRAGMSDRVRRVLSTKNFPKLKALHYVSCSPATFARDAATLLSAGLKIKSVQPFDMFPHADHVEVVGVFHALG